MPCVHTHARGRAHVVRKRDVPSERVKALRDAFDATMKDPGFIEQADLVPAISAARVFVWPSLFEGFGLPVVEALACGAPVLTSSTSSLAEIAAEDAARPKGNVSTTGGSGPGGFSARACGAKDRMNAACVFGLLFPTAHSGAPMEVRIVPSPKPETSVRPLARRATRQTRA